MQALDDGLGDYTQWVHSACPHWTYYQSIVSIRPPPMQALDGGLGDYTQWVYSACPHWTYYQNKSKTPADVAAIR